MCALYAFLRVADDLSDEPGEPAAKRPPWPPGARVCTGAARQYHHPLHPAFHHTVRTHAHPLRVPGGRARRRRDGPGARRLRHLQRPAAYCYRVASAVGLACIHIWGFADERAKAHAEGAGLAFQLTNILRDLGEDAAWSRLPAARRAGRFGYDAGRLRRGERDAALPRPDALPGGAGARLLRSRAGRWLPLLRAGRAGGVPGMARTYRALLDAIERRDYDVFSQPRPREPVAQAVPGAPGVAGPLGMGVKTKRQGDRETRRQGDRETRRQGKKTRRRRRSYG